MLSGRDFRAVKCSISLEITLKSGGLLLGQFALDLLRIGRQLGIGRLDQPVVEPADMFDRAQAMRRNAKLEAAIQRFGHQRNVLQIGQKDALGLVVGVADVVTNLATFTGQFANAGHDNTRLKFGAFPQEGARLAIQPGKVKLHRGFLRASARK